MVQRKSLTPKRLTMPARRRIRPPVPDRGPTTNIWLGRYETFQARKPKMLGKLTSHALDKPGRSMPHWWLVVFAGDGWIDCEMNLGKEEAERAVKWYTRNDSKNATVEYVKRTKGDDQADRTHVKGRPVLQEQRPSRHKLSSVRGRKRRVRRAYQGGRFVDVDWARGHE